MAVLVSGCVLVRFREDLDAIAVFAISEARLVTEQTPSTEPTDRFQLVESRVPEGGDSSPAITLTDATDDGWCIVLSSLSVDGTSGMVSVGSPVGSPASDGLG